MANKSPDLTNEYLQESVSKLFSGTADPATKAIGIELEVFPFRKGGERFNELLDVENGAKTGICDLLKNEAAVSDSLLFNPIDSGVNQFKMKSGGLITFEPGGQVEFSSTPHESLRDAFTEVTDNLQMIHHMLIPESVWFYFGGMTPWHTVAEVGLKNSKPRYRAMDKYFKSIGPFGQQMMRLTTSIQVNLDFGEPEISRNRWAVGNLLVPMLTAIFGNTPYHENRPSGFKSYRSKIWQNLDPSRTGFPFTAERSPLDEDPREQYLDFALNANTVLLPDAAGNRTFQVSNVPFREWIKSGQNGVFPEIRDWEDHVTLLFPEVRPKGFLEFRSFDGQSRAWWSIPALLLTSILYDDSAMESVINYLSPYKTELRKMLASAAKSGVDEFPDLARQVFESGLNADGYDMDDSLKELMERFYKTYTFQGLNPSDRLLKCFPTAPPSPLEYSDFEQTLVDLADPPEYAVIANTELNVASAAAAVPNTASVESCTC